MDASLCRMRSARVVVVLSLALLCSACADDTTGVNEKTGVTLQGTVTLFNGQAQVVGITVTVDGKSVQTDQNGSFVLRDFRTGDRTVLFEKDATSAQYSLNDVETNETFVLNGIQLSNGQVSTAHTGTWVGTGGSSDPGSQGQVSLTMIIQANGNRISGSASIPAPDATVWTFNGTENGTSMFGVMNVASTNSACASDVTFSGTFAGNTLSGTFTEIAPPVGCGPPESGTFSVVQQ